MRAERERNKNCASTGTPLHNSLPPFGTVIPKPPLRRATILPISGKSDECQTSHRPTRKSKSSQLDLYKIKNGKLCQFTQCCVSRSDTNSFAPRCEDSIAFTSAAPIDKSGLSNPPLSQISACITLVSPVIHYAEFSPVITVPAFSDSHWHEYLDRRLAVHSRWGE